MRIIELQCGVGDKYGSDWYIASPYYNAFYVIADHEEALASYIHKTSYGLLLA